MKYKYKIKQLTTNYEREYEYFLPFERKIMPSPQFAQ